MHGRAAALRAAHRPVAAGSHCPGRRRGGGPGRVCSAGRAGLVPARSVCGAVAAALVGAGRNRLRHGFGHVARLRAAALAAAASRARAARAAPGRRGSGATALHRSLVCSGHAGRFALVVAARRQAGWRRICRLAGAARGAVAGGPGVGARGRACSSRYRWCLALWLGECGAAGCRQRGASGGLRARADGIAAAGGGAERLAAGMARQPAGRCAQPLPHQHCSGRGRAARDGTARQWGAGRPVVPVGTGPPGGSE